MRIPVFGSLFAINRYNRYAGLQWKEHSKYKGLVIERCYDGPQPKACYRALHAPGRYLIVGEGLWQVKNAITQYFDGDRLNEVMEVEY